MNSNNNGHAYLFTTTDIEKGQWEKHSYNRSFHDPNIFFDGDTPYIVYGSSSMQITQMSPDLHSVISDSVAATTTTAINNTGLSTSEAMGGGWEGNQGGGPLRARRRGRSGREGCLGTARSRDRAAGVGACACR